MSGASERPGPARARVRRVLAALGETYRGASTALVYRTRWQLLVATILSAQCTDERVNRITARLFRVAPDAPSLAALSEEEIAALIRECGLFRSKARHLAATSRIVAARWGADLPPALTREDLMALPGVGRKTANVVLANAYGADALAVDTHVFRVAHRLGWSDAPDARRTEEDLLRIIPRSQWKDAHHWLIWHGRRVCRARRPACGTCVVARWCPSADRVGEGQPHDAPGRGQGPGIPEPHPGDARRAGRAGALRVARSDA
ncbi:MAG: endonuclease III [Actinomycetia bacterium]|nr:endonuclease III [Actinomycetes bacterium]